MKMKKIAIFVLLLSIIANITAGAAGSTDFHTHRLTENKVHYCYNANQYEYEEHIRMMTPRLQYLYFENLLEIVHEVKKDIPENYFCVVVEEKNWVQEARRNVDENTKSNKCSKKC